MTDGAHSSEDKVAQFQRDLLQGATRENAARAATTTASNEAESAGPGGERIWRSYLAMGMSVDEANAQLARPDMAERIRSENNLLELADYFGGQDRIPAELRAAALSGIQVTVTNDGHVRMQAGCSIDAGPCDGPDVQIALHKLAEKLGEDGIATLQDKGFFSAVRGGSKSALFLDPEVQQALSKIKACYDLTNDRVVVSLGELERQINVAKNARLDAQASGDKTLVTQLDDAIRQLEQKDPDQFAKEWLANDPQYQSLTSSEGFKALQAIGFQTVGESLQYANDLNFDLSNIGLTIRYSKSAVLGVAAGFAVPIIAAALPPGVVVVATVVGIGATGVKVYRDISNGDFYAVADDGVFLLSGFAAKSGEGASSLLSRMFDGYKPISRAAGAASTATDIEAGEVGNCRYLTDIAESEIALRNGGHVIERHVGWTDAELIARANGAKSSKGGASSYSSLEAADYFTSETIQQNGEVVQSWLAGTDGRLVINGTFNQTTGRWVLGGGNSPQWVSETRIVLVRDPNKTSGYTILTSYPSR
jgi:hypothetical protein